MVFEVCLELNVYSGNSRDDQHNGIECMECPVCCLLNGVQPANSVIQPEAILRSVRYRLIVVFTDIDAFRSCRCINIAVE